MMDIEKQSTEQREGTVTFDIVMEAAKEGNRKAVPLLEEWIMRMEAETERDQRSAAKLDVTLKTLEIHLALGDRDYVLSQIFDVESALSDSSLTTSEIEDLYARYQRIYTAVTGS